MHQARGDPDFLEKPPGQLAPRPHGGMQHLERDNPVVPEIPCLVHGRHAAGPDLLADLVRVGERGAEAVEEFGGERHCRSVGQSVRRRTV